MFRPRRSTASGSGAAVNGDVGESRLANVELGRRKKLELRVACPRLRYTWLCEHDREVWLKEPSAVVKFMQLRGRSLHEPTSASLLPVPFPADQVPEHVVDVAAPSNGLLRLTAELIEVADARSGCWRPGVLAVGDRHVKLVLVGDQRNEIGDLACAVVIEDDVPVSDVEELCERARLD